MAKQAAKKTDAEQEALIEKIKAQAQWEDTELERISKAHKEPKVIMLKVPLDDTWQEFAYGWLKYPDRDDISIAMTMEKTDPLRGKRIIIENSWLEGDKKIYEDTELFLSTCTVLDELIGVRQAIVKKNWTNGL